MGCLIGYLVDGLPRMEELSLRHKKWEVHSCTGGHVVYWDPNKEVGFDQAEHNFSSPPQISHLRFKMVIVVETGWERWHEEDEEAEEMCVTAMTLDGRIIPPELILEEWPERRTELTLMSEGIVVYRSDDGSIERYRVSIQEGKIKTEGC